MGIINKLNILGKRKFKETWYLKPPVWFLMYRLNFEDECYHKVKAHEVKIKLAEYVTG